MKRLPLHFTHIFIYIIYRYNLRVSFWQRKKLIELLMSQNEKKYVLVYHLIDHLIKKTGFH